MRLLVLEERLEQTRIRRAWFKSNLQTAKLWFDWADDDYNKAKVALETLQKSILENPLTPTEPDGTVEAR
jgi:hypothetical protein